MHLEILDTDRFFRDSPDAGEPDCICSRCHKPIPEGEKMFRQAVDSSSFLVVHKESGQGEELKKGADGYEFRLCRSCINNLKRPALN